MKLFSVCVLLLQICESFQNNSVAMLLSDFADSNGLKISLHTCWGKKEEFEFMKSINRRQGKAKYISIYKNVSDIEFSHNNLIAIVLNNCVSGWSMLLNINRTNLFISPPKFFFVVNNIQDVETVLQNSTAYPASEIFIAEGNGSNYIIKQPYRINSVSDLIWENYGSWSPKYGLKEYLKKYATSRRRRNLRQQSLKLMIRLVDNDTWNHLDDLRNPGIDTYTKSSYGVIKCLVDYCNANASYTSSDYFGYYNNDTGKFNGIIGALINKEVDLSGTTLFANKERLIYVDYLGRQSPYDIKFIVKKPPLSYIKDIFVLAFEKDVWISIGAILTAIATGLFFILNSEAKQQKIGHHDKFSASDVALISLEALCQQGTTTEPQRISGRVLALITFLAFMFVYVAYSANIVAMLQSQIELKSTKELLESRIEVGCEDTNYIRIYVSQDKEKIRQQLYQKKIGKDGFYSFNKGMEKLRKGFFAYQVELGAAYNYIINKFNIYEMCCLQEIEGYFNYLRPYVITQKNSPYKEIFKTGSFKVDEYGLRRRNYIRYFTKPFCQVQGTNFESIGLVETRMPFLLLMYGISLAVLFLLGEKIVQIVKKDVK